MPRVGALVLAAGSGQRFGQPKQFLELVPGVRLVDAALEPMLHVADEVVLVLPPRPNDPATPIDWSPAAIDSASPTAVVAGGASRLESVRLGLVALGPTEVILVHDAGHPLATADTARAVVAAVVAGADAAVPYLPVVDVLKRQRADGSLETAGRDGLGQAQTPHAFRSEALRSLHQEGATEGAWEDTQLIEECGGRVVGVDGDAGNIHVVTPADLEVCRRLYRSRTAERDG